MVRDEGTAKLTVPISHKHGHGLRRSKYWIVGRVNRGSHGIVSRGASSSKVILLTQILAVTMMSGNW